MGNPNRFEGQIRDFFYGFKELEGPHVARWPQVAHGCCKLIEEYFLFPIFYM
jgi:hypothetical protein